MGETGDEGSATPDSSDKRCPTPVVECDMDITETLVAQMRAMRLDDPELYEALMLLVSRELGRRVENNSTEQLTGGVE